MFVARFAGVEAVPGDSMAPAVVGEFFICFVFLVLHVVGTVVVEISSGNNVFVLCGKVVVHLSDELFEISPSLVFSWGCLKLSESIFKRS